MRPLRLALITALATASFSVAAAAAAAATYSDSLKGIEVAASSTQGTFIGTASGALPGQWAATVNHTPLSPNATITGGSFSIATTLNGTPTLVTGRFSGGTVTLAAGSGCTNQQFTINGTLINVGTWYSGTGTGSFSGTLTHYRTSIFGSCVTYSASVTGSVTLTF
jgi:hypothetical protein